MENPEEILHSLEEFSKLRPKDIPKELEDYLCFVAKTGDPIYQWGTIKNLFKEKLINVITEFYESCPSIEIPPCPNVEVFNYETMKTFILEKLETFPAAPFTVQRICELLTKPRKEYNRIDKFMRALEKNILVVSTTEPGFRRATENGEGIVNGLESEHLPEINNGNNDINVEEMDETPVWSRIAPDTIAYQSTEANASDIQSVQTVETTQTSFSIETRTTDSNCGAAIDAIITCRAAEQQPYVSIEPVASESCLREETIQESDVTVTITAIPAAVQKRRDSIEPVVSSGEEMTESNINQNCDKENQEMSSTTVNTESVIQHNMPSEAEASFTEDNILPISVNTINDKIQTSDPDNTDDDTESTVDKQQLIQIPIISEITTNIVCQETEQPAVIILKPVNDVNVEESTRIEVSSELSSDISTTVSSTVETGESHSVICEYSTIITKETSVSSTNEFSSDLIKLPANIETNQENDSKTYQEDVCQEDKVIVDCMGDSKALNDCQENYHNKNEVSPLHESYASSSTTQDLMEIDVRDDNSEEPPASDG